LYLSDQVKACEIFTESTIDSIGPSFWLHPKYSK